jgi:hypothetical protein
MPMGPVLLNHYGFVMYGFCSKLVCLCQVVKATNCNKDTSLLRNMSIRKITNLYCFEIQALVPKL